MKHHLIKKKPSAITYDHWISIIFLALLSFGLLMVASASMGTSDRQYGFPLHFFIRQAFFIGIGLFLTWLGSRIPLRIWQKYSLWLIAGSLLMLVLVLIPGIGKVINGSRRWLSLGFFGFEVSEAVKLCAIVYLASYLQRFQEEVKTELKGFIKPIMLLGFITCLLLMEPDFGAASVIALTFFALLFIAGARLWPFIFLLLLVVITFSFLAVTSPYRLERLTTFLNPWQTAYSSGYQLTQSLMAFGRGGIFGVGLGNSMQKLFYLPEAHTDFVFAVIAEELGLVGELLIILLYVLLVIRIISIGRKAYVQEQLFSAYLACGIGFWLSLQFIINIGVNTGLLPTKGLTLPFISYGGSSLLVNCLVIGVVLRLAFETQRAEQDYPRNKTDVVRYHSQKITL